MFFFIFRLFACTTLVVHLYAYEPLLNKKCFNDSTLGINVITSKTALKILVSIERLVVSAKSTELFSCTYAVVENVQSHPSRCQAFEQLC